jgi:hypothetical protein
MALHMTRSSSARGRAQDAIARLRASNLRLRHNVTGKGKPLIKAGAVVAGGAISGAISTKMPEIAGIDSRLLVGGLAVAAGVFGVKGQTGEYILLAGAGMLASYADDYVGDMVSDAEDAADVDVAA